MWIEYILTIMYIIFLIIEIRISRKNDVNLFVIGNWIPLLFIPCSFILAISMAGSGIIAIIELLVNDMSLIEEYEYFKNSEGDYFAGYYLSYFLGGFCYVIFYIRRLIYSFIKNKNKLELYRKENIFYIEKGEYY